MQAHGTPPVDSQDMADLCASLQEAVADILTEKALKACAASGVPRLVITGGVAANSRLRSLAEERGQAQGVEVFAPPHRLCTDNAAMIAAAGWPLLADLQAVPPDRQGLSLDALPTLPVG
jgi:N6-L-threonylcarbamoyladenine synthase